VNRLKLEPAAGKVAEESSSSFLFTPSLTGEPVQRLIEPLIPSPAYRFT